MNSAFHEYEADKAQLVPQGWYVWTHKHDCGLYFHILLVIHPRRDEFTIEIGWSKSGKLRSSTSLDGRESILLQPLDIRLARLWQEFGFDPWWVLVTRPADYERRVTHLIRYEPDPIADCLSLVEHAVQDAGQKLKEYAGPLFEEIVHRHGKAGKL